MSAEDSTRIQGSPEARLLPDTLRYLVVDGAMGMGKSDLARLLAAHFSSRLILESDDANPYLDRFYRNPERWAFQTQIAFLTSRYRQQRTMRSLDLFHHGMVANYAFDKDRIFAELNLRGDNLYLYETLYAQMEPGTPRPDLVVFLQGSIHRSLRAIRERARGVEANIDEGYVAALHDAYTEYYFRYTKSPLLIINTDEMDCVNSQSDFQELVLQIAKPRHHGITYLRQIHRGLFS